MNSSDEEDDDTAQRMEACGEAPSIPPAGYQYAPCPPLATEEEQRALKGRKILAAHLLDGATGWFMGTVQAFGWAPRGSSPTRRTLSCTSRPRPRPRSSSGASPASCRQRTTGPRNGGCFWSRRRDMVRERQRTSHFYVLRLDVGWLECPWSPDFTLRFRNWLAGLPDFMLCFRNWLAGPESLISMGRCTTVFRIFLS